MCECVLVCAVYCVVCACDMCACACVCVLMCLCVCVCVLFLVSVTRGEGREGGGALVVVLVVARVFRRFFFLSFSWFSRPHGSTQRCWEGQRACWQCHVWFVRRVWGRVGDGWGFRALAGRLGLKLGGVCERVGVGAWGQRVEVGMAERICGLLGMVRLEGWLEG